MTRPLLLVTRPAAESARTAAAAEAQGFAALAAPLLEIAPLGFAVPHGPFDALLFTSARAPQLVAEAAPELRAVPAHAVGARTAEAVSAAGFRLAGVGSADGTALVADMAHRGLRRVLHLAGAATAPLAVPDGLTLVRVTVYEARPVSALPGDMSEALARGRVFATLLFSARTARLFRRLLAEAGMGAQEQRIVALSAAVAEAAGGGWLDVAVAERPDLPGALAAARGLWQGAGHGR